MIRIPRPKNPFEGLPWRLGVDWGTAPYQAEQHIAWAAVALGRRRVSEQGEVLGVDIVEAAVSKWLAVPAPRPPVELYRFANEADFAESRSAGAGDTLEMHRVLIDRVRVALEAAGAEVFIVDAEAGPVKDSKPKQPPQAMPGIPPAINPSNLRTWTPDDSPFSKNVIRVHEILRSIYSSAVGQPTFSMNRHGGRSVYFDFADGICTIRISDHDRKPQPGEIHISPDADYDEIRGIIAGVLK